MTMLTIWGRGESNVDCDRSRWHSDQCAGLLFFGCSNGASNAGLMGVPVPKVLVEAVDVLKRSRDQKDFL